MNLAAYRELVRCGIRCAEAQSLAPRVEALARRMGDTSDDGMRIAAHQIAAKHSGWIVLVLDPCVISPRKNFPPVRVRDSEREANMYAKRAARYGLACRIEFNPKRRSWSAHDPSQIPPDSTFVDCVDNSRDPGAIRNAKDERPNALPDGPADE